MPLQNFINPLIFSTFERPQNPDTVEFKNRLQTTNSLECNTILYLQKDKPKA